MQKGLDRFKKLLKMNKNRVFIEPNLNQGEIHKFGELLLHSIANQYDGLMRDTDYIWGLELDIELLKKISRLVVNLQNGRTMIENENKRNKQEQIYK